MPSIDDAIDAMSRGEPGQYNAVGGRTDLPAEQQHKEIERVTPSEVWDGVVNYIGEKFGSSAKNDPDYLSLEDRQALIKTMRDAVTVGEPITAEQYSALKNLQDTNDHVWAKNSSDNSFYMDNIEKDMSFYVPDYKAPDTTVTVQGNLAQGAGAPSALSS